MSAVLVAGSAGGIGRACVEAVEASGMPAVGVDLADGIDITRPGGAEKALARAAEAHGSVSGVVHAIGMSGRSLGDGGVAECTDAAWSEVHRVNHESVFRLLRASIPAMPEGGSIVVIGSALGSSIDDDFRTVAYASAKGGLIPLIRVAAREAAPRGVRINLVSAGLVATPMSRRARESAAIRARMPALMPLGARPCRPEEVAQAVLWLLSPASGRTTGAVIPVDGGWHLR
ncbi:SDR family oxidoreductase [Nonomuraea roseoviolacea]|uniref:NAD(P)-dependent dehydrogenase (Short-subunit alcohol dehydrogenase family) n=1 Tax=Nonomuraea roseoviolacea subsp. carminata TaxID=160689 RepID=A0ABT1KBK7_9ACTN|nr:SDR family oxidoreductase [Nonomuraea roseoviolacea]MCP2351356.1 NAD(P)-dependent dehydrogenase (short-subunit alcohol dehydrogenase family) [Nonomuraea roseoviolacea subsp. carminata]